MKTLGRRRWKLASGYHRQGRVENACFRYTSIIGDGLRARSPAGQGSEVVLGCEILNRMTASVPLGGRHDRRGVTESVRGGAQCSRRRTLIGGLNHESEGRDRAGDRGIERHRFRDREDVDRSRREGRDHGPRQAAATAKTIGAHPIHADVAREADVRRSYKDLFQAFDHLDVLVNNAGFGVIKPLVEMDLASFERVFATNVTGAMLMAREAAKHFMERNSGHIVNIGSTAAVRGATKGTAYYGSKFALRGMTECWRAELRPYNVRVMLVNPSEVLTDFYATAGLPQNKENPTKLQGDDIAHAVRSALEMDDRGFTIELTVFATNPKD